MNELSTGKAPSLSLSLTLVEADQFCLVLVSSDPSCGSIVSSSTAVQSTWWEAKLPGPLSYGKPPASQPESESLVSEDEEEEDDEEESEEELLALRRDGWVFCSAAGFSAGGNKHKSTIKTMSCRTHNRISFDNITSNNQYDFSPQVVLLMS